MVRRENLTYGAAGACRRSRARSSTFPLELAGILYLFTAVLFGILLVWQPASMANLSRRARELERQVEALRLENHDLKAEISRLESLTYVEYVARTRLGMVDPPEVKTAALVAGYPATSSGPSQMQAAAEESSGISGIIRRIAEILGGRWVEAGGLK